MPEISGSSAAAWERGMASDDLTVQRMTENDFFLLYDQQGRPQRVQGRNMEAMLAKRDAQNRPIFLKEAPAAEAPPEPAPAPVPEAGVSSTTTRRRRTTRT